MKHTMKKLLGVLLALTMAIGLLPGMLSTAHADGYCPNCGSTNFEWDEGAELYLCFNCDEIFDSPSATPPGGGHTHSWRYAKNNNSIKASCTDDSCNYFHFGITLTINAPSSLVCDGSAKAATISGSIPEGLELETPSGITYDTSDGEAPTEPGTYTASFSWGGRPLP